MVRDICGRNETPTFRSSSLVNTCNRILSSLASTSLQASDAPPLRRVCLYRHRHGTGAGLARRLRNRWRHVDPRTLILSHPKPSFPTSFASFDRGRMRREWRHLGHARRPLFLSHPKPSCPISLASCDRGRMRGEWRHLGHARRPRLLPLFTSIPHSDRRAPWPRRPCHGLDYWAFRPNRRSLNLLYGVDPLLYLVLERSRRRS